MPKRPVLPKLKMRNLTGQVRRTSDYYFANGGFADVWKCDWHDQTAGKVRSVAVKVLRSSWTDPDYLERLQRRLDREARVWSRLSHPNIIPFYGACFDLGRASTPCLVAPFLENGHIMNYLSKHPEADRLDLVTQIAAGLDYLHNLNPPVVHGDLKGSNILINDDGEACLTDFGLARVLQSSGFTTKTIAGTVRWMAMELVAPDVDDEKYSNDDDLTIPLTEPTDVWALGMTILEILTGKVPFAELRQDSVVLLSLIRGARPRRPPDHLMSDHLWEVITQCWQTVHSNRPAAQDIALALDLIHSAPEHQFGRDAVIAVLNQRHVPVFRPYCSEAEKPPLSYPCKWVGCTASFAHLNDCKDHELREYNSRRGWLDMAVKAGIDKQRKFIFTYL
ncbi:kinase-like protein [Rickenella mellea]|uniref:Kinase-like protein n=1 Tax=Rickenella mellea TaxID=50990 RepID=A0A4Y7PLL4_9AGAM|nr:kinase-like protein [Rickenella mellea]